MQAVKRVESEREAEFLTVDDVAARYGISASSVIRGANKGAIPFGVKIGGARRWPLAALKAWEENGCQRQPASR